MPNTMTHSGGGHLIPRPQSRFARAALANLPYFFLYAIAVVLIAMTDHNPASTQEAWNFYIPLMGIVSAMSGWNRHAGDDWKSGMQYILRQALHWGALLLVVRLLFLSDVQHFLRAEDDGFVIIYLFGLASILAGAYLDWKMALFGLFLIFSGVFIAFLDDNALLLAIGGTALIAVLMTAIVWIRYHQNSEPPRARLQG